MHPCFILLPRVAEREPPACELSSMLAGSMSAHLRCAAEIMQGLLALAVGLSLRASERTHGLVCDTCGDLRERGRRTRKSTSPRPSPSSRTQMRDGHRRLDLGPERRWCRRCCPRGLFQCNTQRSACRFERGDDGTHLAPEKQGGFLRETIMEGWCLGWRN